VLLLPLNAQLFQEKEFYPGVKRIKTKQYSGSGGGGYWTSELLDSLGRTVEKKNYRHIKLLAKWVFIYNQNNDLTFEIQNYDINNQNEIDTFRYLYSYDNQKIIKQLINYTSYDSTVTRLISIQGDSIFNYQCIDYHYRVDKNLLETFEKNYILTFKEGLLIKKEEFEPSNKCMTITIFEYYNNGKLKRRTIERIPDPEIKSVYVGGPGADDMSYEYKYDSFGRVIEYFIIIEGRKYKMTEYKYKKT
jgi:hypothetical protein